MDNLAMDFCDAWDEAMDFAFVSLEHLSDEQIALVMAMFDEDEEGDEE